MKDDRCKCGSTSLFSGYFDADGYAYPLTLGEKAPEGVTYKTYCNDCGGVVKTK